MDKVSDKPVTCSDLGLWVTVMGSDTSLESFGATWNPLDSTLGLCLTSGVGQAREGEGLGGRQ